jgi:hypothetical protein
MQGGCGCYRKKLRDTDSVWVVNGGCVRYREWGWYRDGVGSTGRV